MATNNQLKFYKSSSIPSAAKIGSVWFNTTNRTINVRVAENTDADWQTYSGLIDAVYANNTLTITKADGTPISVDFSGIISALSTLGTRVENLETWQTSASSSISTLQTEMNDVEALAADNKSRLDVLEGENGIAKTVADAVKAEEDRAKGVESGLNTRVGALETASTQHGAAIEALQTAVGEGGSVDTKISNAITEFNTTVVTPGLAAKVDNTTYDAYVEANDAAVAAAKKAADDEKVRALAAEAAISERLNEGGDVAAAIAANAAAAAKAQADIDSFLKAEEVADAAIDTLKEIQDWIANDETGTEALIGRVSANESAIATLKGDANTTGSVAKAVADAKKAIEGTLADGDAKTLEAINDELDALVQADIDNLAAAKAYAEQQANAAKEAAISAADSDAITKANAAKEAAIAAAKEYTNSLAGNYDAAGTAQGLVNNLNAEVKDETGLATASIKQVAGVITELSVDVVTGSVATGEAKLALASDVKNYVDNHSVWEIFN